MDLVYLPMPDICAQSAEFGLQGLSSNFQSPGGMSQGIRRTALWKCTLHFKNQPESGYRALQAMLGKLTDPQNVVLIRDPTYSPRGTVGGTPKVDGANQAGSVISTRGWTASEMVLREGDLMQFTTRQMVRVTENITSTSTGTADIPIAPYLRAPPADSSLIEVLEPVVPMYIPKFSATTSYSIGKRADLSIDMLERLP